jgi:hypothetical protein
MLPSQAAIIFSIASSVRLDAILNPLRIYPAGNIGDELGLNSALCENIWWRRGISTTCCFRPLRTPLTIGLRTLLSIQGTRSPHSHSIVPGGFDAAAWT